MARSASMEAVAGSGIALLHSYCKSRGRMGWTPGTAPAATYFRVNLSRRAGQDGLRLVGRKGRFMATAANASFDSKR